MWLESFQDDVGWYLKDDIWDEEHGQGGIILRAREFEVLLQTKDGGVGNVGAVEEGQQIHETEDWDYAQIDLGDQSALRGMRRAPRSEIVVIFRSRVSKIGIVIVVAVLMLVLYR